MGINDNPDNVAKLDTIEVIPGKPANIHVELTGEAFIEGHKGIQVSVQAWDAFGNTVSDGTSVNFSLDGNAVFASSDDGITNGHASAFIQGASVPDDLAKLIVTVGEVTQSVDFIIQPLNVAISDYPTQLEPQKSYPITVTVTEPGGAAVSGVSVMFNANAGRFKDGIVQTAGNGQAIAQFYSGFNSVKNLAISARAGLIAAIPQTAEIKPSSDTYSDTATTVVVGDELANGIAEYERYDGARINLGYKTEAHIRVHGKPEQILNLTLGSLSEPNLQPIASYGMSDLLGELVPETNGLHNGQASHVTIAHDDPTGSGKSYRFSREALLNPADVWESSKVIVPLDASLKPQNSVGFRVDINASDVGGDIFTLEGGVQGLSLLSDGRLKYQVYTSDGEFSVTSAPITNANWQTVAGRYKDGNLQLEVNGALTQVAATGTLAYSTSQRGLTLGENFSGKLSGFKLYDWDRAPLITFEDGSLTKSVTLAAGQVEGSVRVISTGQLNKQGESANSFRIGLKNNDSDAFVSVISKEYYGVLASMYVESAQPEGYPPIAHNGELYKKYVGIPFIASAHAGFGDWILENAYDTVIGIVGVLIPFGDFKIVGKQLYNLAYDRDEFDVFELTISSIGVLSVIPVAKALKPLSAVLRRVLGPMKGNSGKFFKSIGGVLAKVVDQAMEGRYDILLNSLPFLIIAAEMANDDEARKGLTVMINSIASSDDLLAWMDYLSLPADGWDTDEIPSVIDEEGNTATAMSMEQQAYPWADMPFVGSAYAVKRKNKKLRARIDGKSLGNLLSDVQKSFKGELSKDPQKLSKTVGAIGREIKRTDITAMRKIIFSKPMLKSSLAIMGAAGSRNLVHLIRRGGNIRMSPIVLIGAISYLESRMNPEACSAIAGCKLLDSRGEMYRKIRTRYALALGDYLAGNYDYIANQEIGAAFHIAMIAVKHLEYELSGENKIIAVEGTRNIPIYIFTDKVAKDEVEVYGQLNRRFVDIVLEGGGKEIWVEVKSLTGPYKESAWQEWNPSSKNDNKARNVKQFTLDRIAATDNPFASLKLNDKYHQSDRFEWWLQSFKKTNKSKPTEVKEGYLKADTEKVKKQIKPYPKSPRLQSSLGYSKKTDAKKFESNMKKGCYINTFSLKNWLKSPSVKDALLEGIADEILSEFDFGDLEPENVEFPEQCT